MAVIFEGFWLMIILWCENDMRALYNILSSVYYNMDTCHQGSNAINLVVAGTGRKECVYLVHGYKLSCQ